MIAVIRIKGKVGVRKDIGETLNKLRLRKKYGCIIVREKPETFGMIKKVRNFVAYGKISKNIFIELLKKRGKLIDKNKKIDFEKVANDFIESKTEKKLSEFNVKPFFSLHPPRGGIKSKEHYPKGVLGDNGEKINLLLEKML